VDVSPVEVFLGLSAGHDASGAVGRGVEGIGLSEALDDEGGRGHGAGDDAEGSGGGGGCAFAVDDEFARLAVDGVGFFPGEVVVVLDGGEDVGGEALVDVLVDEGVVCGGEVSHEGHGGPVFLAFCGVEVEPGEFLEFSGEFGVELPGEFGVVGGDGGAWAARA